MDWFRLQPLSIPELAQFIMAAAILGYLVSIRDKSPATRLLVVMFVGFAGYMLMQFLQDSVVAGWGTYTIPFGYIFGVSSFLPMMMFAYVFLGNPFEREYAIARPAAAALIVVLCLNVIGYSFGLVPTRLASLAQVVGLVGITLLAIFTVGVFARKAGALNRAGDSGDPHAARAHRDFALAFIFIPLTLVPAIARDLGYLSPEIAASVSTVFFLLFFFAFVLVFVNHAPEPTTVQVKLVGLAFVTILVVVSVAGPIANPRAVLEREARWIVSTDTSLDYDTVYRQHAHNKTIGAFWVVIVTSGLVLALFPMFFRTTLLTRLETLLGGVRRINDGDLDVELEAPIADEIGYLTTSFNRMTASLREQIREIVGLTERNAAVELEKKLLEAENDRKTRELEEARKLQLSMLPQEMPDCASVEVAASMETATEVGGDYYDFVCGPDGSLTTVIGDATGHGMNAGTVVAATKGLYHAMSDETDLSVVLKKVSLALKKMNLPGLYMALGIVRIKDSQAELIGSGLPAALVFRESTGSVEEFPLKGAPLGSFVDFPYRVTRIALAPGDSIVLLTDGFPELFNARREMLGYDRAAELLGRCGSQSAPEIVAAFKADAERWTEGNRPDDDVTVVALKTQSESATSG